MNEPKRHAIAAGNVFDGWTRHKDAAVVVEGSLIVGVVPQSELPLGLEVRKVPAEVWLAPGFIDLQVNGGGDVLFNNSPTPEAIRAIAAAHRKFGTTALLPTFITDTCEKMTVAFAAAESLTESEPGILGIHLEGPFLSSEKAGVHDASLMRQPGPADLKMLCGPRKGALLVTLAPERVPNGFIAQLAQSGVRVSLGHSMATYEETLAAMAEGLSGFTHLFNAMRPLASREPGPIAAALESPNAWFGMIVDGFHVNPAMLRLALRGVGQPILVTDAMPPVGGGQSKFDLYGVEIQIMGGVAQGPTAPCLARHSTWPRRSAIACTCSGSRWKMPSASLPEIPQNLSALGIFWVASARDIAPILSHWMLALSTCWGHGLRGRNQRECSRH